MSFGEIIGLYYIFIFIFVGIIGSIFLLGNADEFNLEMSFVKTVFMHQYVVYTLVKDNISMFGIIILEIFVTISVWFLNVIIFVVACGILILWAICFLFSIIFARQ